jgi:undecaprenyl-diphosphatase
LLGTVPAVLIGWLFADLLEGVFARPVAAAFLTASESLGRRERDLGMLAWFDALLVGLAQALAMFLGISGSGATIAAGLGRDCAGSLLPV